MTSRRSGRDRSIGGGRDRSVRGGGGGGGGGSAHRERRRRGGGEQENLREIFRQVDTDGSGEIDVMELQRALSNGSWDPFNEATVRLMIGLFDKDGSGGVNFPEFCDLWAWVRRWVDTFNRYDVDSSGAIDEEELRSCLTAFGYRLRHSTYRRLMRKFDRSGGGALRFDDYLLLCVQLQSLTSLFRQRDTRRSGTIVLHYEDFLDMLLGSHLI